MLSFNQVSAHYGKIQALHQVSLNIKQGEIVTLIGANGAGKTTLLGTLCGEPRATEGSVTFLDQDITQWQTSRIMREAVAIVPEGRRVFSRMTVEENLAMGGFLPIVISTSSVSSGCSACSRACWNAATSAPAPCPAVNSRCWRSAAR